MDQELAAQGRPVQEPVAQEPVGQMAAQVAEPAGVVAVGQAIDVLPGIVLAEAEMMSTTASLAAAIPVSELVQTR